MTKPTVCFALLACAFGADAADWRMDLFSPMTNERPDDHGARVDDQGDVHLQAFNRPWAQADRYETAHRCTFDANGHAPWMRGLARACAGDFGDRTRSVDVFDTALAQRSPRASRWLPPGESVERIEIGADGRVCAVLAHADGPYDLHAAGRPRRYDRDRRSDPPARPAARP